MPNPASSDTATDTATNTATINVLLVGGGAREHALAIALKRSKHLGKLHITHPQNPGLAALGIAVEAPVNAREAYRAVQYCDKNNITLVVIGPEEPLAEGLADKLRTPDRLVFGPDQAGARLESDKAWAKSLMRAASIPTAEARVFKEPSAAAEYALTRVEDETITLILSRLDHLRDQALKGHALLTAARVALQLAAKTPVDAPDVTLLKDTGVIESPQTDAATLLKLAAALNKPRPGLPVVKAAGLAKGKGVIVPANLAETIDAIHRIMIAKEFGPADRKSVV